MGSADQRHDACLAIDRPYVIAAEADTGTEYVTLQALWKWAQAHPGAVVMYGHTKGAGHPAPHQAPWRRAMLDWIVRRWPEHCLTLARGRCDIVGSRTYEDGWTPTGWFDGGFWIARAAWVGAGPPPQEPWPDNTRWHLWPLFSGARFADTDGTVYVAITNNLQFGESTMSKLIEMDSWAITGIPPDWHVVCAIRINQQAVADGLTGYYASFEGTLGATFDDAFWAAYVTGIDGQRTLVARFNPSNTSGSAGRGFGGSSGVFGCSGEPNASSTWLSDPVTVEITQGNCSGETLVVSGSG